MKKYYYYNENGGKTYVTPKGDANWVECGCADIFCIDKRGDERLMMYCRRGEWHNNMESEGEFEVLKKFAEASAELSKNI